MSGSSLQREKYVEGFSFERHTYKFRNDFKPSLVKWGYIPCGDAQYGLCGGMALASQIYYLKDAKNNFDHKCRAPDDKVAPTRESNPSLLEYLKECQVATITASALFNYVGYMWTGSSTDTTKLLAEWPKIQQSIDKNEPSVVGLIIGKGSLNPRTWLNFLRSHQVLVYGYQCAGTVVSLLFYDPSREPSDNPGEIRFDSQTGKIIEQTAGLERICSFFKLQCNFFKTPPSVSRRLESKQHQEPIPSLALKPLAASPASNIRDVEQDFFPAVRESHNYSP